MKLRRRRPERDIDDLRKQADERELGWDTELADQEGKAWHDWPETVERPAPGSEPEAPDVIDVTDPPSSGGADEPAPPADDG